MLEFINKYRKSPKRMVVTFKCKKSLYLLRQGQLNCKTNLKNIEVETPDCNSSDVVLETNFDRTDGDCFGKDDSVYAFNSCENLCEVNGGFEQICNENYCENQNLEGDCKRQKDDKNTNVVCENVGNKRKFFDKTTKGAYVCQKTYRMLLCDIVAVTIAFMAVTCILKRIFKHKH